MDKKPTREELVNKLLNQNVDLSPENYRKQVIEKGDTATAGHGVKNKAPVSETVRLHRMQMNHMGAHINYLSVFLSYLETINQNLIILNEQLHNLSERG